MKAKIENNKLVIVPESAGEKLALEIWRLGEASIILEAYNAQQSFTTDSLKAVVNSLPKSPKTGKPLLAKSG